MPTYEELKGMVGTVVEGEVTGKDGVSKGTRYFFVMGLSDTGRMELREATEEERKPFLLECLREINKSC